MSKITRNDMKDRIRHAVHLGTMDKETQDLVMAINVLEEIQQELRDRVNERARAKRIQAHTFMEWRELGYTVIRGQKCTGRNADGVATFLPNQVTELYRGGGYLGSDDGRDWDFTMDSWALEIAMD